MAVIVEGTIVDEMIAEETIVDVMIAEETIVGERTALTEFMEEMKTATPMVPGQVEVVRIVIILMILTQRLEVGATLADIIKHPQLHSILTPAPPEMKLHSVLGAVPQDV